MNPNKMDDLSSLSMLELFRVEAENQAAVLTSGLLELERGPGAPGQLETLMRAAHSWKGAARIVNLPIAVKIAHAMEDCLVAAQHGKLVLRQAEIDLLFRGVDLLLNVSKRTEADVAAWEAEHRTAIQEFLEAMTSSAPEPNTVPAWGEASVVPAPPAQVVADATTGDPATSVETNPAPQGPAATATAHPAERVLRLTADNLNRLLGLAGESLVESPAGCGHLPTHCNGSNANMPICRKR